MAFSKTPKQKVKVSQSNKENQVCLQGKSKVSFQSRKILEEKGKKGMQYVPIQERVSVLMKEKQEKIAKMQKISHAYK